MTECLMSNTNVAQELTPVYPDGLCLATGYYFEIERQLAGD